MAEAWQELRVSNDALMDAEELRPVTGHDACPPCRRMACCRCQPDAGHRRCHAPLHRGGRGPQHHFSLRAGGLIIDLKEQTPKHPELDMGWFSTNFELRDTLFFPALTAHKAFPNLTEDRMRISLDNRYQRVGDRISEHMLVPHMTDVSPLSWEEVYKDWKSDELKYYWTKVEFQKIPRYWGYARKGFQEAMALARKNNTRGILAMRRTIRSNSSSEDARAVLRQPAIKYITALSHSLPRAEAESSRQSSRSFSPGKGSG